MDPAKVKVVRKWPRPTKVIEEQQFIDFVQYVRKFIKNFSAIAAPLTNLIKGSQAFKWSEIEQHAFDQLKEAVCSQPLLKLPDFTRPFEIHTDASDYARVWGGPYAGWSSNCIRVKKVVRNRK